MKPQDVRQSDSRATTDTFVAYRAPEPTPDPSQEGRWPSVLCSPPGRGQGWVHRGQFHGQEEESFTGSTHLINAP